MNSTASLLLSVLLFLALCGLLLGCILLWKLFHPSPSPASPNPPLDALLSHLGSLPPELSRLKDEFQNLQHLLREEAQGQRQELHSLLTLHRNELSSGVLALQNSLERSFLSLSRSLTETVEQLSQGSHHTATLQNEALARFEQTQIRAFQALREELATARSELSAAVHQLSADSIASLTTASDRINSTLAQGTDAQTHSSEKLRATVELKLAQIQSAADSKLEQMRLTVDEKLSHTLSARLGDTFKQVSDRLEAVQQGFGEMRSLAGNVTDLRRIMTNVKTRGVWGEVQLAHLLEQLFAPAQYEANFKPKPRSNEVVEFAIKLPGAEGAQHPVYLPIDSKFPIEDYQRLVAASEIADLDALKLAQKALQTRIYQCAADIRDKYIAPPYTTNFAVLFLPTEALYAEVLKMPGLLEDLTRTHKVIVQGPTTFSAFVMSLLMGFRTLAIQKRSAEIDKLLGAIRTDFGKFSDLLAKVEEKLDDAKTHLGKARSRSTQIVRKLGRVETLPDEAASLLLPDPEADPDATIERPE